MTKQSEAVEFLQSFLADGPKPQLEVIGAAEAIGISERTLKRAKADAGVESKGHGRAGWTWEIVREGQTTVPLGTVAVESANKEQAPAVAKPQSNGYSPPPIQSVPNEELSTAERVIRAVAYKKMHDRSHRCLGRAGDIELRHGRSFNDNLRGEHLHPAEVADLVRLGALD